MRVFRALYRSQPQRLADSAEPSGSGWADHVSSFQDIAIQ